MVRLHLSISLFAGGYQPFSAVKGKPSINSKISIHNKYLEFIPRKLPSYPVAPKFCYILVVMCTLRSMSIPFRDPCASPPIHGTSLSLSLSTFVSGYWLPPHCDFCLIRCIVMRGSVTSLGQEVPSCHCVGGHFNCLDL